jgi:hypothetical protein
MSPCRKPLALASATILATLLAGCGGPKEAPGTGSEPSAKEASSAKAETAPAAKTEISLPKGWAMSDAISAADVGAITGETMTYFPEAGSKAQEGRPAAGFTVAGKDFSKIAFSAVVGGGEKEFESTKGFAVAGSVVDVPGVGDKAYTCDFVTGATAIVVLKGQDVFRVDWQPKTYANHEKVEFGKKLAGKLLEKVYR